MAGAAIVRARKRPRLGQHPTPSSTASLPPLPLDLVLEIAGHTNPATLVRCAATCKDLRRRIADPAFRHHLHHGDHFARALLRGHLVEEKYVAVNAPWCSPAGVAEDEPFTLHGQPVAACDGLVLVRGTELRVYSSATGRHQTIPPEPKKFSGQSILLAGDGEDGGGGGIGRSFKVLHRSIADRGRCMKIQTFSSEHGAWGPRTTLPSPLRHPTTSMSLVGEPLVFRDAVHWLCSTHIAYHILTLQVGAARLTSTELPPTFPNCHPDQVLLAAEAAGRSPVVLVADANKICALSRSERTGKWRRRPQVVIKNEAIGMSRRLLGNAELKWFGQRSGVVLICLPDIGDFCWLDLRNKEIIKSSAGSSSGIQHYFPYEMDLSDWVPTFSRNF